MWSNNLIQFARLISEIQATQDNLDIDALCVSMDLKPLDISELFDRAVDVWHEASGDNDQAICVHCDESHHVDADHECKEGE